jgi:hypothetical protein
VFSWVLVGTHTSYVDIHFCFSAVVGCCSL